MKFDSTKLQVLTAAAIVVLISGGFAAYAQQTTTTTSTTSTTTSSTTTTTPTTTTTTTSTTSTSTAKCDNGHGDDSAPCRPPPARHQVTLALRPVEPNTTTTTTAAGNASGYRYGNGVAIVSTAGGVFNLAVAVRGANPTTQFSIVLVVNGTSYTLGSMVTRPDGSSQVLDQLLLKTGTYVVSVQVYDTSTFGTSTLVMQSGHGMVVSAPLPTPGSHQGGQGGQGGNGGQGGQGGHGKGSK